MSNKHIGSDFNEFLQEEGISHEVKAAAIKRVVALQIQDAMKTERLTKTEVANRMHSSRAAVDRLLDPENPSITLLTLVSAADALGKELAISIT